MVLVSMIRKGRLATKDTKREGQEEGEKKEIIKAPGQLHRHKQERMAGAQGACRHWGSWDSRSGWGLRKSDGQLRAKE